MNPLYPLCFTPVPKERVWGGNYLATHIHPHFPLDKKIGESWELCGLEGSNSVVCNGFLAENEINELVEIYMGELVGDPVYRAFADEFPLLVKILDINDYLSFQVHPSDKLAKQRHHAYGKAEAWYVLHAEPDAKVYLGFNRPMHADDFRKRCLRQTLPEVMNEYTPHQGDCFYIPPGTVHAAGGGLVIAEIQEVSDITYRVYDWGREFHKETARDMHIDLALDAINWEAFRLPQPEPATDGVQSLVRTPYFNLSKRICNTEAHLSNTFNHSFRLLICTQGAVQIAANEPVTLQKGGVALIPAAITAYAVIPAHPGAEVVEAWIAAT